MATSRTFDPSKNNQVLIPSANYAVSDISTLPADFTNAFIKLTIPIGTTRIQFPLNRLHTISVQVLKVTNGSGFTQLACKLQASNIGGTSADVWADISSGVNMATTDETTILLPTASNTPYAHIGVNLVATGGSCDIYLIAHGMEHS
jgi:hypothetical protein